MNINTRQVIDYSRVARAVNRAKRNLARSEKKPVVTLTGLTFERDLRAREDRKDLDFYWAQVESGQGVRVL